jgi:U3 small nucleolar RNA-associated protein 20
VYIKQDLNDFTRQATAFSLLKSIISRKLVEPELEKIVHEVEQMSIVAETANVRQQCRQLAWQFMLDYPLGDKKLDNQHLEFYLQQLKYEHDSGRSSALEMLTTIFSTFPQSVLIRNCDLFFSSLVLRLINDESSNCRQMAATALKMLLSKLNAEHRDRLIDMCIQWMDNGTKMSMLRMSAKAVSLFVEIESLNFRRHLMTVLPRVQRHLKSDEMTDASEEIQRQHDLLVFDFLMLLLKIVQHCRDEKWSIVWCQQPWSHVLNDIWGYVEVYLSHAHTWIKFVAAQLFNELFSACPPELVVMSYLNKCEFSKSQKKAKQDAISTLKFSDYLVQDLEVKLHSLGGAFCHQLSTANNNQQLADQVLCNLLHICQLLIFLPPVCINSVNKQTSLFWLIKRLIREVKLETSGFIKSSIKRKCVYQWLLGLAKLLGKERISDFLTAILQPLVREMTDSSPNSDDDIKSICQQSLDGVKQIIGNDEFCHRYAALQQTIAVQRQQRKTQRSVEAVTNPELNARRKLNKNIKKQEAKKRKIADFRPSRSSKKIKTLRDKILETF